MSQSHAGQAEGEGQRPLLGLSLALSTMLFWATLPVILKYGLGVIDAMTLTWVRFLAAFLFTAAVQVPRGALKAFGRLRPSGWSRLTLGGVFLVGNYVFYLLGLGNTSPGNAQVLIQLAPVLMTLGGLAFFGERYNRYQWLGFFALLSGLALFSSGRTTGLLDPAYLLGSGQIILAAILWAGYALFQKALLRVLTAQQVMLFIYLAGSVLLLPFASPGDLLKLEGAGILAVGYCCINTIGAYGAFAEAMRHWEASRISAILAITPMGTFAAVAIAHQLAPEAFPAEGMTFLAWVGAILAIVGSSLSSLAKGRA